MYLNFGRKALAAHAADRAVPWHLPVRYLPGERRGRRSPRQLWAPDVHYPSGPVGSARSAPRELRDRCRLGLTNTKIENADDFHLLHLTGSGCGEVRMSLPPGSANAYSRPRPSPAPRSPLASQSGTLESMTVDIDPALVDEAAEFEGPRPYTEQDRKRDADWCRSDDPREDDPAKWPPGLGPSAPKLPEDARSRQVHWNADRDRRCPSRRDRPLDARTIHAVLQARSPYSLPRLRSASYRGRYRRLAWCGTRVALSSADRGAVVRERLVI